MKHISTEQLKEIKEKLLAEQTKLEKELAGFSHKNPNVKDEEDYDAEFVDMGDTADDNALEVAEYEDRLSLEHVLEKSLNDVKNTLKKIEAKEYGDCKYCKEPIPVARLLARPASGSCVECKERLQGVRK